MNSEKNPKTNNCAGLFTQYYHMSVQYQYIATPLTVVDQLVCVWDCYFRTSSRMFLVRVGCKTSVKSIMCLVLSHQVSNGTDAAECNAVDRKAHEAEFVVWRHRAWLLPSKRCFHSVLLFYLLKTDLHKVEKTSTVFKLRGRMNMKGKQDDERAAQYLMWVILRYLYEVIYVFYHFPSVITYISVLLLQCQRRIKK